MSKNILQNRLEELINNNAKWAADLREQNPDIFNSLAQGQSPRYLWIGCSDSRMAATTILGLGLGDIFVHRNIANLVSDNDDSAQAIIEFAVNHLAVQDIVVCGHYGCGGVLAATELNHAPNNVVEQWVMPIRRTYEQHKDTLAHLDNETKHKKLCELNVAQQVENICRHSAVQNAWSSNRELFVHGMIYDIANGLVRDLEMSHSAKI